MATKKVFSSTSLGIPKRQKMLNKNTHTKWMMEYNEKIKDHRQRVSESRIYDSRTAKPHWLKLQKTKRPCGERSELWLP